MRYFRSAADIAKQEWTFNGAGKTLTAAGVDMCQLDLGALRLNDVFMLSGILKGTKGATGEAVELTLTASGTGTARWYGEPTVGEIIMYRDLIHANAVFVCTWTLWGYISGAGTILVDYAGKSAGSDTAVPQKGAHISGLVFASAIL